MGEESWKRNPKREWTEEASGAKELEITSREAAFRTAEQ